MREGLIQQNKMKQYNKLMKAYNAERNKVCKQKVFKAYQILNGTSNTHSSNAIQLQENDCFHVIKDDVEIIHFGRLNSNERETRFKYPTQEEPKAFLKV